MARSESKQRAVRRLQGLAFLAVIVLLLGLTIVIYDKKLPWQASDAQQLASDLLERGRPVDAFVVGNDFFALGIYRALRDHGLTVPTDAMVMGWGNYPFTLFMEPSLSTIVMPTDQIARGAVARLLARLDGTAEPGIVTERFEPELVLRGSTAR